MDEMCVSAVRSDCVSRTSSLGAHMTITCEWRPNLLLLRWVFLIVTLDLVYFGFGVTREKSDGFLERLYTEEKAQDGTHL